MATDDGTPPNVRLNAPNLRALDISTLALPLTLESSNVETLRLDAWTEENWSAGKPLLGRYIATVRDLTLLTYRCPLTAEEVAAVLVAPKLRKLRIGGAQLEGLADVVGQTDLDELTLWIAGFDPLSRDQLAAIMDASPAVRVQVYSAMKRR